jgi:hypothetical protein
MVDGRDPEMPTFSPAPLHLSLRKAGFALQRRAGPVTILLFSL